MLPAERRRQIVESVTEHGGRSVDELATFLDVSKATVRRDLSELEERGLIERSHGGAVPVMSVGGEQTYDQREVQNLDAKRAIAARAVEEIHDGAVVFFDSGTTTMEAARAAPKDGSFLAVTNSPRLAVELGKEENDVKLTGGTLRRRTRALVGPTAESFMGRMHFDLLFLGTNAIDDDGGLTTPNEDEARMKELMVERSNRVVLVSDTSKLSQQSFVQFAHLDDVDMFVTDAPVPDHEERFEASNVRVEVAD
jgi:DeoR family fructose operon transcriptional repressor